MEYIGADGELREEWWDPGVDRDTGPGEVAEMKQADRAVLSMVVAKLGDGPGMSLEAEYKLFDAEGVQEGELVIHWSEGSAPFIKNWTGHVDAGTREALIERTHDLVPTVFPRGLWEEE